MRLLLALYEAIKRDDLWRKIWRAKLWSVILPPEIHVGSVTQAGYDIANF